MKILFSVIRYDFTVYLKSAKSLMPLVVLLAFLGALYAYKPTNPISCFNLTMNILFFIMVWVGISQNDIENPVSEQLMILKVRNAAKFYIGNMIFLLLLSFAYGAIAVGLPLIANAVQGGTLFTHPLSAGDAGCAFLLNSIAGFAGCAVGSLMHPRIVKDRKLAMLLAFVIAILGIVKVGIHNEFPASQYVTWIFPPMADVNILLGNDEMYNTGIVGTCLVLLIAYAAIVSSIKVVALIRKKF